MLSKDTLEKMKTQAIIVDIDGTISNYQHRKHYIGSILRERHDCYESAQWDNFNKACVDDKPITEVISILKWARNASNTKIILMTGRNDKYRGETIAWLARHNVKYDRLLMRRYGDTRSDVDVKIELYNQRVAPNHHVLFVLEDRDKVVEMWRELGLRCLQVAKGEY